MAVEVWWRNPERYIRHVVSSGAPRILWHQGKLIKRRINPIAHATMHFPAGVDWRCMVIGAFGAVEYGPGDGPRAPRAVYPVWHYGEQWTRFERLLKSDVPGEPWKGENPFYRPRAGQARRIVIINRPNSTTLEGKRFMAMLGEAQEAFPATKIHLFECRHFRPAFAYGVAAADLDPEVYAGYGEIQLPNGKRIHVKEIQPEHHKWLHVLGYSAADERWPMERRLTYNMRSALWASEHFIDGLDFKTRSHAKAADGPSKKPRGVPTFDGDMVACDHCSLFDRCKAARVGGVCSLPGSETAALATYFKTRDTDRIMEGLGELLATQAERVERAMEWEAQNGQVDGELSRILKDMLDGGVKLAKLANPALAAAGRPAIAVQINAGGQTAQVTAANPASLMAAIVKEIEASGIPRDQITPEMIMRAVGARQPEAIEVSSHDAA